MSESTLFGRDETSSISRRCTTIVQEAVSGSGNKAGGNPQSALDVLHHYAVIRIPSSC